MGRTRTVVAGLVAAGLVAAGATVGAAMADGGGGDAARAAERGGSQPVSATGSGYCAVGFQTRTDTTPPIPNSSTEVSVVGLRKTCPGPVVATFTAEVNLNEPMARGGSRYVHAEVVARCTGTGGLQQACSTGTEVRATPGNAYLRDDFTGNGTTSASMQYTFKNLKRGVWRFVVLAAGDGASGSVAYRTLKVEAIKVT